MDSRRDIRKAQKLKEQVTHHLRPRKFATNNRAERLRQRDAVRPHLVMMAFLHRVANGGGTLERDYAIGMGCPCRFGPGQRQPDGLAGDLRSTRRARAHRGPHRGVGRVGHIGLDLSRGV